MLGDTVEVTVVGLNEVSQFIKELPERLFTNAKIEVAASVANIHEAVSKRIIDGNPMHSRTGALKRSMQTRVAGTNFADLYGVVYTTSPYAPIQEHGGTVKAKKKYMRVPGGPYLNIPLKDNLTKAGVMLYSAKDVFTLHKGRIFAHNGKYFVAGTKGLMFVLVKESKIPARLGMLKEAERELPDFIVRLDNHLFESRQFYE
jgi:phage gpG-like protein